MGERNRLTLLMLNVRAQLRRVLMISREDERITEELDELLLRVQELGDAITFVAQEEQPFEAPQLSVQHLT